MLSFRKTITQDDLKNVHKILTSTTGFFDSVPGEIDVGLELVEIALKKGNTPDDYAFLFLEKDGQTIGYMCYSKIACTMSTFELLWMAVHNDFRGQGLGKKLMQEMIKTVQELGARKFILETSGRDLYIPTRAFHEACGFKLEARIKDYYAKGDDCLIYSIDFD